MDDAIKRALEVARLQDETNCSKPCPDGVFCTCRVETAAAVRRAAGGG
jgi:hypothetical protein